MTEILFHKYEILELIGSGGGGKVYLARDRNLERPVVIKESREELLAAETELLKELRHPGLPLVYDCFREQEEAPQGDSLQERTFLVMEYIEGMSLRRYLDKHGKVPEGQALKWAMELCRILEYLHGRHPAIIYRDLKPENIMIRQDGMLKLIDFGGALKFACGSGREVFCVGTPGYSPKEQWEQTKGDVTWDIYGLGAVLHEMLTGANPAHPPYERRSVLEYDRSLSGAWDRIIGCCTAKEASRRYQAVGQLLQELERLGRERLWDSLPARLWRDLKHIVMIFSGGYTALCFILPLIRGVPETSIPFPYLEKALLSLMITLILYLIFYGNRKKRSLLCRQEKNLWLTEKKFSGLLSLSLLLIGKGLASIAFGGLAQEVYAGNQPGSLWVEMRDDLGRKMLLKDDAVYVTDDRVRFELPADRLPDQELALKLVAVGEDGAEYDSRVFLIRARQNDEIEDGDLD